MLRGLQGPLHSALYNLYTYYTWAGLNSTAALFRLLLSPMTPSMPAASSNRAVKVREMLTDLGQLSTLCVSALDVSQLAQFGVQPAPDKMTSPHNTPTMPGNSVCARTSHAKNAQERILENSLIVLPIEGWQWATVLYPALGEMFES